MIYSTKSTLLLLAVLLSDPVLATTYQSHEDIKNTAVTYVLAHVEQFSVQPVVTAGNLDSRLRLNQCSQPIKAYESPNGLRAGKGVVGVRCSGKKPWKIFVRVTTTLPGKVVVASRPIRKGEIISSDDLMMVTKDLASLHKDYYQSTKALIGLRAKRRLKRHQTITPAALATVRMVKRGGQVTIIASTRNFHIQMKGKALANGAKGDRIKVRNTSSGREIQATVISSGVVLVAH